MTLEQIIGLVLAWIVMGIGLAGSLLPAIPSTPLVWIAAIAHQLYFGQESVGWFIIAVMGGIAFFSLLLDYLASMLGAKKLGASKAGIIGAVMGGIVGLFFGLIGVLTGPFLGAFSFEWISGRKLEESVKSGFGATLGLLAGAVGKLACCLTMMILFTASILWNSF